MAVPSVSTKHRSAVLAAEVLAVAVEAVVVVTVGKAVADMEAEVDTVNAIPYLLLVVIF